MVERACWLWVVLGLCASSGGLVAEQPDTTARRKALAHQSACGQAVFHLFECVKAIAVNDHATVADLVSGSEPIASGLTAFLAGATRGFRKGADP